MQLATRIGTMARRGAPLPYLRRVEYLESNGNQFLDTNTKVRANDVLEIIAQFVDTTKGIVACGSSDEGACWIGSQSGLWFVNPLFVPNTSITKRSILKYLYLNDRRLFSINENDFATVYNAVTYNYYHDNTVTIFGAYNRGNVPSYLSSIRCYGLKIYDFDDENDCALDIHPVLDLSGRPAMYDEVSGNLFYNQGTGEFTWGELET